MSFRNKQNKFKMIHTNQSDLRDMIRNLKKRKEKEKRPTIHSDPRQRSKGRGKGGIETREMPYSEQTKKQKSCGVGEETCHKSVS